MADIDTLTSVESLKSGRKADLIAGLKARISRIEHGGASNVGPGTGRVCPLGVEAIDTVLPGGGMATTGLHEIAGPVDGRGDGSAIGFVSALVGRFSAAERRAQPSGGAPSGRRAVIWIGVHDDLHAPALSVLGLDASDLIRVRARGRALLWSAEEAVRSGAAAAVVMECDGLDLTASRRLQLASEAGRTPVLMLRRRLMRSDGGDAGAAPIAAQTRWVVTSRHSLPEMTPFGPVPGLGDPVWRLALMRSRGGGVGRWDVVWSASSRGFSLLPVVSAPEISGPPFGRRSGSLPGAALTGDAAHKDVLVA